MNCPDQRFEKVGQISLPGEYIIAPFSPTANVKENHFRATKLSWSDDITGQLKSKYPDLLYIAEWAEQIDPQTYLPRLTKPWTGEIGPIEHSSDIYTFINRMSEDYRHQLFAIIGKSSSFRLEILRDQTRHWSGKVTLTGLDYGPVIRTAVNSVNICATVDNTPIWRPIKIEKAKQPEAELVPIAG